MRQELRRGDLCWYELSTLQKLRTSRLSFRRKGLRIEEGKIRPSRDLAVGALQKVVAQTHSVVRVRRMPVSTLQNHESDHND